MRPTKSTDPSSLSLRLARTNERARDTVGPRCNASTDAMRNNDQSDKGFLGSVLYQSSPASPLETFSTSRTTRPCPVLQRYARILFVDFCRWRQQHITRPRPQLRVLAPNHTIQSRWQFSAHHAAPPFSTNPSLFFLSATQSPGPLLPTQPRLSEPIALPHHQPAIPAPAPRTHTACAARAARGGSPTRLGALIRPMRAPILQ